MRGRPFGGDGFFRRQPYVVLFHPGRSMGNFKSVRGGGFDRGTGKVVGGGESPSAVGNDAHTHAYRFGIRSAADFSILGTESAAALSDDACVGVSRTAQRGDVQGPVGDVVHGGE